MIHDARAGARGQRCRDLLDRPIFIVSTPRSGSTLLFETLARAPGLFTTGEESHRRIESIGDLHPRMRDWTSNRLEAAEASDSLVSQLADAFYPDLKDRSGAPASGPVRMLEKTPKNALRVPFLAAAWPDALFVYLYRRPEPTLSSMMEAWSSGRFRTYPRLPGWTGHPWSLLLVPGWRDLIGLTLPEVVAHQWARTTDILVGDLARLPPAQVRVIDYDRFVAAPQAGMEELAAFLGLGWDQELGETLPYSRFTVSRPSPDKWRQIEELIEPVMPIVEQAEGKAQAFVASAAA